MTLTDFLDKLHDPLTAATAAATMAGMIARLSGDQLRDAPGDRWTEQAGNAIERLEHEPDDSLDEDDESPGCLGPLVVALFLIVLVATC